MRILLSLAILPACSADDPETTGDSESTSDDGGETAPAPTWRMLVSNDAWQPDTAQTDPRPDHRPPTVDCELGWYLENGGIEIDTATCNYLSLEQPLLESLEPGDPLHMQLWWQTLASVDPAEGHWAIYVDGELLWEELVPIPGPAEARTIDFESPLAAPAGATSTLHLHNHGYNTWHFHELSVLSSRP